MRTHKVRPTETLWRIGRHFDRTVEELAQANHLKGKQRDKLKIDQILIIPDKDEAPPDTVLKIKFGGLDHKQFTPTKVKVEHDGSVFDHVLDEMGFLPLAILDHSQGLKIWIEDLTKKMVPVMDRPTLPLGKWNVAVDSRTVAIKGNLQPKVGKPETTTLEVKTATTQNAQQSGGAIAVEQTRAEAGKPIHALATIYTEQNLRLLACNERFRPLIITAANKHGLTPQSLAALIGAEAAHDDNGFWLENSNSGFPRRAQGICQFFPAAWTDVFNCNRSLLHNECKGLSQADLMRKRLNARYAIDGAATYASESLKNFRKTTQRDIGSLSPEDTAKLAYLLHHEGLRGAQKLIGKLPAPTNSEAIALLTLQLVHEARVNQWVNRYSGDAWAAYKGWLYSYVDAGINVGAYLVQDEQKFSKPPRSIETILATIDELAAIPKPARRTRARHATPPHPVPPHPVQLRHPVPVAVAAPAPAPAPVGPSSPATVAPPALVPQLVTAPASPAIVPAPASPGALPNDSIWHDPLATCTIRTAGMASINSAKFNGIRNYNGQVSHHQGLDLIAAPGTPIYAVADGVIKHCILPGGSYGMAIILFVNVNDLAPHQLEKCTQMNPGQPKVGFFYAHLSERFAEHGSHVTAGTIIGKTGHSGNASNMTTIAGGAHLHFEVRKRPEVMALHLENRLDPLPFLNNCTND